MKPERLINTTLGLVLSGGGVKGMAHIGLLKALEQRGIYPSQISGVSAGALVGGLYADGASIEEMLLFFKETPLLKYNFVTLNKPGLFDTDKYLPFFDDFFTAHRFEELDKRLVVVATNLLKGEPVYFEKGELFAPLLASAALPPVFSPVSIDGQLFADGGIMNNFPVEPLAGACDVIIGCYASSMKEVGKGQIKSALQISQRANLLMLHANAMDKLHIPDLLIVPEELGNIKVLDKKGIDKAFVLGYDHANRKLDEWLQ
ncbi:patatin-like phospholipase family protein [Allomuricauda sp. CP2A]|jgi:NTE family protein|uniref:patatin-like phospholipase family protein n=1 Tax=Allomuricauda sp. CP2A TaxID=1848189 RepID=UPI000833E305|nr:patatin-like phospholipase family protein [Muricauda sp. CP2A]